MTFTKTIHSITALPVYCIIYICIEYLQIEMQEVAIASSTATLSL